MPRGKELNVSDDDVRPDAPGQSEQLLRARRPIKDDRPRKATDRITQALSEEWLPIGDNDSN